MSDATSEVSVYKPTNELSQLLGEPALVGLEKLEVYNEFLWSIGSAIKVTDTIGWLLAKNYTDLSWEIRREQIIKADIIKYYQKQAISELIKTLAPSGQFQTALYRIFQAEDDLTLWETNPESRKAIDEALAAKGHSASAILAQAYIRGGTQIDLIDRRIAGYERRRDAVLREAGLWNEGLRQRLKQATTAIIDGEFTEAGVEEGK
jgi:hypothetical protein